jgi:CHAD domain-containing protein
MTVSSTETELKYEAEAGTPLPDFDRLSEVAGVRDAPAEQLDAEYYDTSDLRLIRAGVTLRRREGGHDAGWHLKLPAGADTRREIRVPLGQRKGKAVPEALARLVRVHSRGEELRPVATISTQRQRLLLLGRSGEELAEVAADEVVARATGDEVRVSRWREIEVELTGGSRQVLAAADRLLRADGLSRSARAAKLERALGVPPKLVARRRELSASAPAGRVVMAYLRTQAETLKSYDPMVRGDEPDSVHQMRIAVRRMRSTLQTFGHLFRSSDAAHLAGELRWLGHVLGGARDAEVLTERLSGRIGDIPTAEVVGPVQARIAAYLARARADSKADVTETLDSARYFGLLDRLDSFVAEPPLTTEASRSASKVLPAAVRKSYRRTKRRIKRAWRTPAGESGDQALHRARRAAKRARYAGEVAAPAFGGASEFARQMKQVQSVLGDHQDAVIARQVDRELGMAAHLAGENAFTYGLLYNADDQTAADLRREARRTWRKASRRRYRRWLG